MSGKKHAQIVAGLKKLAAKGREELADQRPEVQSGYVTSVDEAKGTMTVVAYVNEQEMEQVLLRGTDEDGTDGILMIPELDSDVVIASVDGSGEWVLVRASKLKKVLVTISGTTVDVSADGVVINNGDNSGLVKVAELTGKINALENDLNALKKVFLTSWIVVANDGGAALKAAAAPWAGQQLQQTRRSDLENTKVKH